MQIFHKDIHIIIIPEWQLEDIRQTGDRDAALRKQIRDDGTHMDVNLATMFYGKAVEVFGWDLEPTDSGKDKVKYYLKEAVKRQGKCTKCGRTRCYKDTACLEIVHCRNCATNHHAESVCPSQVRPCFQCGDNRAHRRKPCDQHW